MTYALVGGAGATNPGLHYTAYRVISLAALISSLAVWLIAAVRYPSLRPATVLTAGIVSSVLALGAGVASSQQPRIGLDYLAFAVLLSGGYLLLQRIFSSDYLGVRVAWLASLIGLATCLAYVAVTVVTWMDYWNHLGHLAPPPIRPLGGGIWWGNPNNVAVVVVLLCLSALADGGRSRARSRTIAALLGLCGATLVLTGSRSAWAALAGTGVLIFPFVWLSLKDRRLRYVVALVQRRWAVLLLATAPIAALILWPAIITRLQEPAADRLAYASASVRMFADHPVTGVGPGMWAVDRVAYTQSHEVDAYGGHAHNLALQAVAELGVAGAAAGAIVAVLVVSMVARGRRSKDPLARRLSWATLVGGVFLILAQLANSYVDNPGVWLCYALIVARLDALLTRDTPPMSNWAFARTGAVLAVAFGVASLWLVHSESAAIHNDNAVNAANVGDWTEARASAEQSLAEDRAMPPYAFTLGLAEAHTGDPVAALAHLQMSTDVDNYPIGWLNIARLNLNQRRHDAANSALAMAMRLGYQQPQVAVGASLMYLELGDVDRSRVALSNALVGAPGMASDPYWRDPAVNPLFEAALTSALASAPPEIGYKLALEGGRSDVASSIVAAIPLDQRETPELVIRAWAEDRASFDALHAAAIANPLDADTVVMCLRVALQARTSFAQAQDWVCDKAGAPGVPFLVRVVPDRTDMGALPGVDPGSFFLNVYRRSGVMRQLVPGIPQLSTVPLE